METLTDEKLMQRVRMGEVQYLGLLFERYHKILFTFFYNRNKDIQLSEDLVQNVFLQILKNKHQYKGNGLFKHWLFVIARNTKNNHFRKTKVQFFDTLEDWKEKITDETINPSRSMMHQEDMSLLKVALNQLDPEKKEILMMSKMQGMKYKEIGEKLGYSEGAIKVKVYRALKELKEKFKQLEA
ncbi:MAG: RNA polymerase sigma factor [Bacteroidota bacterium]